MINVIKWNRECIFIFLSKRVYIHARSYECFSGKRKENKSKKKVNKKKRNVLQLLVEKIVLVLLQSSDLPSVCSVRLHRVSIDNLFLLFMIFCKLQNGIENSASFRLII